MLKKYLVIFVIGLTALSAKAQFKIVNDSLYCYGFAGTTPSSFIEIYGETHIIHTGSTAEVIKWIRIVNQLPDTTWTSAVCDIISCKPPEVDSDSFIFEPGDTGYMSFHFYSKNVSGSGKMIVRFYRASNPLEYVDIVTFGTTWKPVSVNQVNTSITSSTPNPAQNTITFNNNLIEHGKLEIFNSMGQVMTVMGYSNDMTLNIIDFPSGVYIVRISDSNSTSFSRIVKE